MNAEDAKKRYDEKMKRVRDAIELRVPDRIPNITVMEGFPSFYAGVPVEKTMRDFKVAEQVYDKFFTDFDPDLAWEQYLMYPLQALETLDFKLLNWPGPGAGRLKPNELYQFIESVTMYDGEFPEYTADPTRYMLTKWLPRSFGNLKGLEKLSGLRDTVKFGWMGAFLPFADPEVQASLKSLMKGGEELLKWIEFLGYYDNKIEKEFGIPIAYASTGDTPFDMLSDSMRGTINILMDMFEYPEELLEALDAALPIAIESVVGGAKAVGRDFVWLWLHKGMDSFMSDEQYRTFYWPTLKKLINGIIDNGLTPIVYTEGQYNTRLEVLQDVPVGKVVYHFEEVDMQRAKDVLKGIACISGNLSSTVLQFGSVSEVVEQTKKLIDICGKDGGYMFDTNGLVDFAKPENVKAMFDTVREYGRYC